MKAQFLLIVFLLISLGARARIHKSNCAPEKSHEAFLYNNDFKWGYTLPEMISRFTEIYQSEKRLKARAYWDSQTEQLKLPYEKYRGGDIVLPEKFVEQVVKHIEGGFRQDIVDAVFFPDMGHSHLMIPQDRYDKVYEPYEVSEFSRLYEALFSDPTVKVLYHTAEQLKMRGQDGQVLPDPQLQHRFKTRNLIGTNDGSSEVTYVINPNSNANTSDGLPGYRWWGAGFNLSANQNGCFTYEVRGQKFNFDISMYDLGMDPNEPVDFYSGNF